MSANCKQWPRCGCILRGKETDCIPRYYLAPLSGAERRALRSLQRKWACQRATVAEIERCRHLENRAALAAGVQS